MKKVHRAIKFNRKAWLKPNIDMNTELRKNTKLDSEIYFFKVDKYSSFWKNHKKCEKIQR